MKTAFCIGRGFKGKGAGIYRYLGDGGFTPDFILFVFPSSKRILNHPSLPGIVKKLASGMIDIMPLAVLKLLFFPLLPKVKTPVYYVKDINSADSLKILDSMNPDYLVVFSCGIIGKELISKFPKRILSAHAGKLPEFRGVSNVEWAYSEDKDLYGTIQLLDSKVDAGDIVYEEKLQKLSNPANINEIREDAFDKTFQLFPKALKCLSDPQFTPVAQPDVKTTRYKMHPFFLDMLKKKVVKKN